MASTGAVPHASIYGTWSENVEIWSVDDDTLMDLSSVTEITLQLLNRRTKFAEMTLTMGNGDITIPSTGIIQWRAEVGAMAALTPGTYDLLLLLEDADDVVPVILGSVSIVD
jgi:hypothetical protein